MVEVPPIAVPHIIRALEAEIARLREIEHECGEDWPVDFDPNDISLFESVRGEVSAEAEGAPSISYPWGKPAQFSAGVISHYAATNAERLSKPEADALSEVVFKIMNSQRP